jgi:hypothetical protein
VNYDCDKRVKLKIFSNSEEESETAFFCAPHIVFSKLAIIKSLNRNHPLKRGRRFGDFPNGHTVL